MISFRLSIGFKEVPVQRPRYENNNVKTWALCSSIIWEVILDMSNQDERNSYSSRGHVHSEILKGEQFPDLFGQVVQLLLLKNVCALMH